MTRIEITRAGQSKIVAVAHKPKLGAHIKFQGQQWEVVTVYFARRKDRA